MNAEIRQMRTAAEQGLLDAFGAVKDKLPGNGKVAAARAAAFRRFEAQGLPHRRVEEWKYTDLRALMRDAKPLASPPDAETKARAQDAGRVLADIDCRRIVFVDGALAPELSDLQDLEEGLSIRSMAEVLTAGDPMMIDRLGRTVQVDDNIAVALNTAFMGDGAVIHVASGVRIARPLHLVFVAAADTPAATFTRSLVVVEKAACAMIVENHEGPPGRDYQTNTALELLVDDEAHVDHVKITAEGANALHVSTLMAAIGARARFNTFTFTTGGAVVRNQLFVRLNGEGTIAGIRGATLVKGPQHVDTTLVADHAIGGCQNRPMFKSVLDGESRAVFQGKIIVRPQAQKTDAKMATHALLLSENAEADNKPELEIFADDVQCGHGATTGALNEQLLFYLRARGIPMKEAEALLIQAFIGEAIEGIEHAGLREVLIEATGRWLAARA
jgi:Fe-S cluster assembly protein SufD